MNGRNIVEGITIDAEQAWLTVGDLRQAMEGLGDDIQVMVKSGASSAAARTCRVFALVLLDDPLDILEIRVSS